MKGSGVIRRCSEEDVGYIFFFSSRRRHTRYWRDWSSDVCSSDLRDLAWFAPGGAQLDTGDWFDNDLQTVGMYLDGRGIRHRDQRGRPVQDESYLVRSEERRVGKECRSRWSPYH